jgi:NAD(P)-dependent dehydrogenase (short-subunit alcohol dehydrogenase family)
VAFVTGAGGGIGQATCERFLAEGARVVAADIDLDAAEKSVASRPEYGVAVRCDVGDSESVAEAIRESVAAFGRLTTLCQFAGGSSLDDRSVTEATENEFWRAIKLDLFGTFIVAKHALPELIKSGSSSVINTTSIVAVKAVPGLDCYTSAKGGVISLTRSMAVEYAVHGVRVNAVAPGITLSPRVKARSSTTDPESPLVRQHLLGLVEPIDVAHLAVYLASDESRTVTGQILQVDSGATLM